jgi:aminopeptidase N
MFEAGLLAIATIAAPAAALPRDVHSYAETDKVVVSAVALDLAVDFDRRELAGTAELALDWKDGGARTLVLDTRDLSIEAVDAIDAGGAAHAARFSLRKRDPILGAALDIRLDAPMPRVRVRYRTSPDASGLQWMTPAQTAGKQHPFMFSQSESIHARSWAPLQDTPAVRFTYRARIGAPKGLRALMSADNDALATGADGWRFEMPQPIPSYLLALAVGQLEFRPLGKRSGVYAEPGRIEAAAREFEDTERMIEAAESLYGEYRWGRYDLLVLPPSFPFGGMENPRLTFATPTVIAGDKSLVALIAHELAHSWSGNLVTNAGWQHFWLNEGFTTYVENRIVEALYGAEQAKMQQRIDQTELLAEMKELAPRDRPMMPDMKGRDPDDAYSNVPYTRGAWMLRTIEARVGRAKFDAFLRGWFDAHAFESVTTGQFIAYLDATLRKTDPDAMPDAELHAWLHDPELPPGAKLAETDKLAAVEAARADWLAGRTAAAALPAKAWSTQEWQHFLNGLEASSAQLGELDAAHRLAARGNSEIAFRFHLAAIRAHYAPARPALRAYLTSIGRRKLVVPLYEALAKHPEDLAFAREVFAAAKPGYHPMTTASVAVKLGL